MVEKEIDDHCTCYANFISIVPYVCLNLSFLFLILMLFIQIIQNLKEFSIFPDAGIYNIVSNCKESMYSEESKRFVN